MAEDKEKAKKKELSSPRRRSLGIPQQKEQLSKPQVVMRKSLSDGLQAKQAKGNVLAIPHNDAEDSDGLSSRQSSKSKLVTPQIGGGLLPEDIRLKGWVQIKSSSGFFKSWKKHYCVITDNAIYLYKKEAEVNSFDQPTRLELMKDVENIKWHPWKKEGKRFDILDKNEKTLIAFNVASSEIATNWVKEIRKIVEEKKLDISPNEVDAFNESNSALNPSPVPFQLNISIENGSQALTSPLRSAKKTVSPKIFYTASPLAPTNEEFLRELEQSSSSSLDGLNWSQAIPNYKDFQILKALGEGIFGSLSLVQRKYKAKEKKYFLCVVDDSMPEKFYKRGLEIIKSLPNFYSSFLLEPVLSGVDKNTQKSWIAFNYFKGSSLFRLLSNKVKFSEEAVKHIAAKLVICVSYFHRRRIILKNLDTDHVFLDSNGNVLFVDLRYGCETLSSFRSTSKLAEYTPPEYLLTGSDDFVSDWWRLGILVYELLTGLPPFKAGNLDELRAQILLPSKAESLYRGISDRSKSFISKCLEVDPKRRVGSSGDSDEVTAHPFFDGLDWKKVSSKENALNQFLASEGIRFDEDLKSVSLAFGIFNAFYPKASQNELKEASDIKEKNDFIDDLNATKTDILDPLALNPKKYLKEHSPQKALPELKTPPKGNETRMELPTKIRKTSMRKSSSTEVDDAVLHPSAFLAKKELFVKSNQDFKYVDQALSRYTKGGFDLNLTYITERIIAMGFPALVKSEEHFYDNVADDVIGFLESKHPGNYRVFNLCFERNYDPILFGNSCTRYPMQLDNSPSLKQTIDFCVEASRFLEVNEKNVIAVHCSNGVNRSGLMISCLLILMKICNSAEEAAQYFGGKRCVKKEALFLPSQRRYVYYYEDYLRSWAEKGVPVPSNGLRITLRKLLVSPLIRGINRLNFKIYRPDGIQTYNYKQLHNTIDSNEKVQIELELNIVLQGDFKILFISESNLQKEEKLFWVCLNTIFVSSHRKLIFQKDELDNSSRFPSNFALELHFDTKISRGAEECKLEHIDEEEEDYS